MRHVWRRVYKNKEKNMQKYAKSKLMSKGMVLNPYEVTKSVYFKHEDVDAIETLRIKRSRS